MGRTSRAFGWLIAYLVVAVAPLALSLIQLDPGRGFWVNFSVSLGFVGLALMGLQFVLAARWSRATAPFGIDVVLQFHRQITYLAVVLILAHPIILFIWDSRFFSLLNLPSAPWRARWGVISVVLLLVLVATAIWRKQLRLSYATWQLLHSTVAVVVVLTAVLHVLLVGYYVDQPWEKVLWIGYSAIFVAIGVWVRGVKPLQRWRRRWRVVELHDEGGASSSIVLELVDPSSYGAKGFQFGPGQFAWIHSGHSPFALTYHPFSFSSSAERPERVSFTIKAAGRFTSGIPELEVGHVVYLDGPWGHFTLDRHEGPGFVFVAGGIGVTPMLSMLETLADRGDTRPCWLFLANRDQSQISCGPELEALTARMDLTLVHVLSRPSEDWTGETGHLDPALLDRLLPPNRQQLQYFLCGSDSLMDAAEGVLAELDIPVANVHAERFSMA